MKGREGKLFISKRYNVELDLWRWFAQCYIGNDWFVYEGNTLPGVWDFAMTKANEYAEISRRKAQI